jgi:hypothetical protein
MNTANLVRTCSISILGCALFGILSPLQGCSDDDGPASTGTGRLAAAAVKQVGPAARVAPQAAAPDRVVRAARPVMPGPQVMPAPPAAWETIRGWVTT